MNRNTKWVCVVCIAALGAVVIEYSLGTEGFAKETSPEDAAREPLDAQYATNEGVLYSAFIHPLSPLTDGEARSAIDQVANLALTFGTTYQSGNLIFGR